MQMNNKMAAVEAVIFASGEPIEEHRIAEAVHIEKNDVDEIIKSLNEHYSKSRSAIHIVRLDTKYQMCTQKEYSVYIKNAMESKKQMPLSAAAMEALTIIAYNQPVTKNFVENVRGIDSSSVINSLVEKGLLEEDGRLNVPGRPVAYKTSDNFLRCFGLTSLDDLPSIAGGNKDKQMSLFEEENGNNNVDISE